MGAFEDLMNATKAYDAGPGGARDRAAEKKRKDEQAAKDAADAEAARQAAEKAGYGARVGQGFQNYSDMGKAAAKELKAKARPGN